MIAWRNTCRGVLILNPWEICASAGVACLDETRAASGFRRAKAIQRRRDANEALRWLARCISAFHMLGDDLR